MKTIISEFLKRPIAYQPIVAKAFGSVKLAILWCQLYYWSDKTKNKEKWIYKTREDLYDETGLSRKELETARKIGEKLGVLESKRMEQPCTVHFRINVDKACEIMMAWKGIDLPEKEEINPEPAKAEKKKEEDKRPPLQKLLEAPQRHIRIIGIWSRETGINIDNEEIMQSLIKRNLRAATLLKGYKDEDIIETIKVVKNTEWIKKFTLETIGKFIDGVSKNSIKKGPKVVGIEQYERDGVRYARLIYEKK